MSRSRAPLQLLILLTLALLGTGIYWFVRPKPEGPPLAGPPPQNSTPVDRTEPPPALPPTAIHFADGTADSGIQFHHEPHRSAERYMPEIMGSGVLIGDFNRDGAPDLILVNSGSIAESPRRPADALTRLYINDGKGHFQDRTDAWQLPQYGYGMGGTVGDYDNDGWPDVYLTSWGGGDKLLRNDGQRFIDVTDISGINPDQQWSSSAGFFDMDHDGDLDLYVARYVEYTTENALRSYFNKIHIYTTPLLYRGVLDRLFRNNGDGTFSDVSDISFFADGVPFQKTVLGDKQNPPGDTGTIDVNACKGLAIAIADIDGDGDQDIYVANDTTRNFLFINRGNGVFDEMGRAAGVAYGETGTEQAGMGVDFSDVNGDQLYDIVCANFQSEPTNLFIQSRGMFFVDRTDQTGVGVSSRSRLKFGIEFFDADNDGDEELLIANGHIYDQVDQIMQGVSFAQTNSLFELNSNGKFVDISDAAGPALADCQVSRGLATADLNDDGLLDYVVVNNGGTAQIARNESKPAGHWLSLWLEGTTTNRSAIGAKVLARVGDKELLREVFGSMSYLSISDARVHLGLGPAETIDELTIVWPGGGNQKFKGVKTDRFLHLVEGGELTEYTPGERSFPAQGE